MTVDQEWFCDVPRDHTCVINIQLVDVLNNMNAATPWWVGRLHDPQITLWLLLFESLVVWVEIVELLRQDVGVWDEVKLVFSEPLLHLNKVVAQAVLSSDLVTLREVIDALVLI